MLALSLCWQFPTLRACLEWLEPAPRAARQPRPPRIEDLKLPLHLSPFPQWISG